MSYQGAGGRLRATHCVARPNLSNILCAVWVLNENMPDIAVIETDFVGLLSEDLL